jgi:hypothetical protein
MSIELNLESIAKSLSVIAEHISNTKQLELPLSAPVPAAAPVVAPAAAPVPAAVVPPLPSPVAAPAPVGATPTPVPVPPPMPVPAAVAPFADAAGLMEYVKTKYRALGPIKGALIQNVLTEIGCRNVNEVTAGNYGLFYQKVEALS